MSAGRLGVDSLRGLLKTLVFDTKQYLFHWTKGAGMLAVVSFSVIHHCIKKKIMITVHKGSEVECVQVGI